MSDNNSENNNEENQQPEVDFNYDSEYMSGKWEVYAEYVSKTFDGYLENCKNEESLDLYELIDQIKGALGEDFDYENSKMLDIGSGNGHMLQAFKNKGFKNAYGVDVSQKMVSASHRLYPELNIIYLNIVKDKIFAENTFGFVLTSGLLSHIQHDDKEDLIKYIASITEYYCFMEEYHTEKKTNLLYGFNFYYDDYSPICAKYFSKELFSLVRESNMGTMIYKVYKK
eukprot:TRINITY_DN882_c0_g1_i1.p1 TRINITY_DN882_c0_g1~~TRINITY_DN882_c0_g1_i1.p1  ORF type:complete len:255 (-),score=73.23 TRINITY_DN882_c0_g1_i1:91-771(-)